MISLDESIILLSNTKLADEIDATLPFSYVETFYVWDNRIPFVGRIMQELNSSVKYFSG